MKAQNISYVMRINEEMNERFSKNEYDTKEMQILDMSLSAAEEGALAES